ncbi:MAG: glutamate racemase [Paludibacteraceae bacterium]|nr:glutamate racemase [Paludibacteraceae bacterium]
MKIGVFDSGYGGLTILEKIRQQLPEYDYLYLGDNARAPYGTRSFEVIYEYTLQAVEWLQAQGCRLIILACNTASAKALRTIQQHDIDPNKVRVLGVIRPTVEYVIANGAKHIGIMATPGTVSSNSYVMELEEVESQMSKEKSSSLVISQVACPMWVPLIEAGEHNSDGADYFVKKYISELVQKDAQLDTIILGCTHYPLLLPKISAEVAQRFSDCKVVCQGDIVAASLKDYLGRHPEIASDLSHGGTCQYITTESAEKFRDSASIFLSEPITASHIEF